jgi:4-amino-4-deoxy-L-arabinose transferase-like glycosyltransferase
VAVLLASGVSSTRRFVIWVAIAVLLLRLTYLGGPLDDDEAGYLVVARGWSPGGPNLYGHYFVDRPPLLVALYRVAAVVGWDPFVRVLATLFALLLVVSAARAAYELAGPRGARWAALVAGAFAVTPVLTAQEADGEIFAAPLVMLAISATLAAVRRPSFRAAVGAGVAAGAAVMVKQNFVDAVVFAAVLTGTSVAGRRLAARPALRVVAGGVTGGLLVVAAAAAYVGWSRVGLGEAWTTVFGFRGAAFDVIEDHSLHAPLSRALVLVGLAAVSGLLPMLLVLLLDAARCRFRGPPVAWAVAATAAVELASVAMGGSYWPHYLLQLAPTAALAAGLWAPASSRLRAVVAFTVVSAVVSTGVVTLTGAAFEHSAFRVGSWLRASGRPGDTLTVLYGHADVQEAARMGSPYRQLWTLPMRTFDPRLRHLRAVLDGPRAPTWVVVWGDLDPWNIDAHGLTRLALARHYHEVATVCGHPVFLHDGQTRRPAAPAC